jgi:hypothetical protein
MLCFKGGQQQSVTTTAEFCNRETLRQEISFWPPRRPSTEHNSQARMYLAQYPLFFEEETTDNQRLPIGSKTTLPMSPRFLMMITYAWSSIRLLRQPALPRRGRHIIISLRVPFFEVLYYKRQPPQIVNIVASRLTTGRHSDGFSPSDGSQT